MKWSRIAYCAAFTVGTGLLIAYGISPWLTVPLGAFAVWWSFVCTSALWTEFNFRIAVWRLHQAPSMENWPAPREIKQWEWLSHPKLDHLVNVGTAFGVLCFPIILWLPVIIWAFK